MFQSRRSGSVYTTVKLLQRLNRSRDAWKLLDQQKLLDGVDLLKIKATLLIGEQYKKALALFTELVEIEPEQGDHWLNLAACQKNMKQMVAPLKTLEAGVELHPERADLLQALGSILIEHGRWDEGWQIIKKVTEHKDSSDVQHFNIQFAAAGNRLTSSKDLMERAQEWEKKRGLSLKPLWCDHIKERSPNRRLRIGTCRKTHNHPVGRFIEPVLKMHNRRS